MDACPPKAMVVTSNPRFPNLRFMGGGTFSTLQLPNDRVDIAAAEAAEILIKFLRETGYFFVFIVG
jgi:hypothetical protein